MASTSRFYKGFTPGRKKKPKKELDADQLEEIQEAFNLFDQVSECNPRSFLLRTLLLPLA